MGKNHLGDTREVRHANTPVDWQGSNWDRPMWFTNPATSRYNAGYERAFGDRCDECGEHMTPSDDGLHCEACGHFREYSDAGA